MRASELVFNLVVLFVIMGIISVLVFGGWEHRNRVMEVCQVQQTYMIDGTIYKCPD